MIDIKTLFKASEKFAIDNSPGILTGVGVAGTALTAFLTGKASFKAAEIIEVAKVQRDYEELGDDTPMGFQDKAKLVWKLYLPAAGVGVVTVVAVVGANQIGTRRAAAVAAAYLTSERAFTEYRDRVVETMGVKQEQAMRDKHAAEKVRDNPPSNQIIITGSEVICFDEFSGRYFRSDMETLKKAQNDVNYKVINEFYASLSDFYDRVGLPHTSNSDDVGWNTDRMLDLRFGTTMTDDQRPCLTIGFNAIPIAGYARIH